MEINFDNVKYNINTIKEWYNTKNNINTIQIYNYIKIVLIKKICIKKKQDRNVKTLNGNELMFIIPYLKIFNEHEPNTNKIKIVQDHIVYTCTNPIPLSHTDNKNIIGRTNQYFIFFIVCQATKT